MSLVRRLFRRSIRDALRDNVEALGRRVYDDRTRIHSRNAELPAAVIVFNSETSEVSAMPDTLRDRVASYWVELYVRRNAAGDVIQDLADELADEVEAGIEAGICRLVAADPGEEELAPGVVLLADLTGYRGTQYDQDGAGQSIEGGVRITWEIGYRAPSRGSAEDLQLREFLRVDLELDQEGEGLETTFEVREA